MYFCDPIPQNFLLPYDGTVWFEVQCKIVRREGPHALSHSMDGQYASQLPDIQYIVRSREMMTFIARSNKEPLPFSNPVSTSVTSAAAQVRIPQWRQRSNQ